MSIAIVPTKNTMGVRTLSGYAIMPVPRGPAEPGPRAANHPVQGLLGRFGAVPQNFFSNGEDYGGQPPGVVGPTNFVRHVVTPAMAAPPASTSTPTQAPTGAVVSSYTDLSAQIAPSVANTVAPAPNPTSIATVAPASTPGYTVVTSGATNPDYVQDIETWLSATDLLASFGLTVPNWIPAVGIIGVLGYMMTKKH